MYTEKNYIKQTHFQEVLIDRAASVSQVNPQVREKLITDFVSSLDENKIEILDKFLALLCDADTTAIGAEASANSIELDVRHYSNMDGMTPEQRKSYRNTSEHIDIFAEEMKKRFAKKTLEGRHGFDGEMIVMPVADEISNRLDRMRQNEHNIGVGIANWAFISWYRQNILPY
jgi:hypothetical protein